MNAAIAAGAVAGAFALGLPVAADIMRGTHGAPTCAEPVAPRRGAADHFRSA
jgi:hypothetical protein